MKIENKSLKVGQAVYTNLYGYGRGVIFGVHGEPLPENVINFPGNEMVHGERIDLDVVFHCGKILRNVSESVLRGVQWKICDDVCTPSEIDGILSAALQEERRNEKTKKDMKEAFEEEVRRLKSAPEFTNLKKVESNNISVAAVVSSNIRLLLKKYFSDVKFTVKKTSYNSVSVRWTDGPTCDKVEEITGRFKSGYFNSMEDVYEYNESPFNVVYGGINFISIDRVYSDELIDKAISMCREIYGDKVPEWADVDSYKKGKLFTVNVNSLFNNNLQSEIRLKLKSF
ncbi:LPD29 domain-containing protein [Serratia marcescens]|uniref:LPD29 domain-containing protein n=1 Tax=Serratia marcescens TaxID=615 RepID=UPI0013DC5631|nr:LPD29 domain-containing protein [Serratia marcescens]